MVGYYERPADEGYVVFSPSFVNVGGGDTVLDDVIDTAALTPYVDHIMMYDPDDGLEYEYIWDGSGWTDYVETYTLTLTPGTAYFTEFFTDIIVSGEVVNSGSLTYEHSIPEGYSYFGSAFPGELSVANFNFDEVLIPYVDEVCIYDADDGLDYSYVWDGTGFTDYSEYLPDTLAPLGQGVMFGNNSGFTGLVEDINPKTED